MTHTRLEVGLDIIAERSDLDLTDLRVSGGVRRADGSVLSFSGWSDLMGVLEQLLTENDDRATGSATAL